MRVRLATCVTNLVTRHPAITASAAASVDATAEGRTILGIGAGHSGVTNVGGARSSAADLREGIAFLKTALSGAPAVLAGRGHASRLGETPGAGLRGRVGPGRAPGGGRRRRRRLRELRARRGRGARGSAA